MPIKASELILNEDGSVYHLNLRPEHISNTIITVGDPDRVDSVTKHFDTIELKIKKREFHTQTGTIGNKRLTVISTGIGTDNIDIVLNELDALVNIDLERREIKDNLTALDIIRIGTSGAIQDSIPLDSFLISEYGCGFDSLLHFYQSNHVQQFEISNALKTHLDWDVKKSDPYVVSCGHNLLQQISSDRTITGFTATNVGFYGPQSRVLRLDVKDSDFNDKLASFNYNDLSITNLEMETAGIYGLSKLLGHNALSMNAIIANRALGEFSSNPKDAVDKLIEYTLEKILEN
ncbi:nucleoside phosphorylase [Winogradskyella sp. 3972H.M.0a.05]|uniref:nucleoside phosphorylase n=1 Tax=Winogradskyella sp. 3972H.M.0a.05 TaxID=2950277 RepID=UPI0033967AEF